MKKIKNPEGLVRTLRRLPGIEAVAPMVSGDAIGSYGTKIWGARTLAKTDPSWRYINVRRLFNFVSQTLMEGTQWSVFEPNDERLWLKLRASVANFLTMMWRGGFSRSSSGLREPPALSISMYLGTNEAPSSRYLP